MTGSGAKVTAVITDWHGIAMHAGRSDFAWAGDDGTEVCKEDEGERAASAVLSLLLEPLVDDDVDDVEEREERELDPEVGDSITDDEERRSGRGGRTM